MSNLRKTMVTLRELVQGLIDTTPDLKKRLLDGNVEIDELLAFDLENLIATSDFRGAISFRKVIRGLIKIRPDLRNQVLYGNGNIDKFIEKHGFERHLDNPLLRPALDGDEARKQRFVNGLEVISRCVADAERRDVIGLAALDGWNLTEDEAIIEMVLDHIWDINRQFLPQGASMLHVAVQNHNAVLTKLLLNRGADPNISTSGGEWSPLSKACHLGYTDVIEMLLEKGADCNVVEKDGFTPFLFALKTCSHEIVDLLIKHGADLKTTTHLGYTALHAAVMNVGNLGTVDRLLQLGFDLDKRGQNGVSPLELAAAQCWADPVKGHPMYQYLLCRGATYTVDFCTKVVGSNRQSSDTKCVTVKHLALSAYYGRIKGVVVDRIPGFSAKHVALFHRCTQELKEIENSGVLADDVTMLDILATKNDKQLIEIFIEYELMVNYDELKSFPCYGSLVDAVLTERLRNAITIRHAEEFICKIFNFNDRSHIVNQRIMNFLTPKDLQHFDLCQRRTKLC